MDWFICLAANNKMYRFDGQCSRGLSAWQNFGSAWFIFIVVRIDTVKVVVEILRASEQTESFLQRLRELDLHLEVIVRINMKSCFLSFDIFKRRFLASWGLRTNHELITSQTRARNGITFTHINGNDLKHISKSPELLLSVTQIFNQTKQSEEFFSHLISRSYTLPTIFI